MPVFDPSGPSAMPNRIRFCVDCAALILSSDWESCRHCGGSLTLKPPARIMSRAAGRRPAEGHAPPTPSEATTGAHASPAQPDRPRCEACGNYAKSGTRRCRPCAAAPAGAKTNQGAPDASPIKRKQQKPRKNNPGNRRGRRPGKYAESSEDPVCIGCRRRPKAVASYCGACFDQIERTRQRSPQPLRTGIPPRPSAGGPQQHPRSSQGPSVQLPPIGPRSERRTQGPIRRRPDIIPEDDPWLENEFAKGMRGRPRGDITE
jgi:hypothetical protein